MVANLALRYEVHLNLLSVAFGFPFGFPCSFNFKSIFIKDVCVRTNSPRRTPIRS